MIIGGGISGLVAAYELSKSGQPVAVLEARQRLGGRIHTATGVNGQPVELGAEFIHGKAPEICDLLSHAGLPVREAENRRRLKCDAGLINADPFWDEFSRKLKSVNLQDRDQPFANFIAEQPDDPPGWKDFAKDLIEGFDAAPADHISLHSVARERDASERIDGDKVLRVVHGYGHLIAWLEQQLRSRNVPIHLGSVVERISWKPAAVKVTDRQGRKVDAARAIITIPMGVLKAGEIHFEPALPHKEEAIRAMGMGHVVKVSLEFRSRFWPEENFGFVQTFDENFPTWWSHAHNHHLTGWAGGTRAMRMAGQDPTHILEQAICSLAELFGVRNERVRAELHAFTFHDWTSDLFSRGAYSYIPSGGTGAQTSLAEPVQDTLFFAGEATALNAQLGTVHGAIASAFNAVKQLG